MYIHAYIYTYTGCISIRTPSPSPLRKLLTKFGMAAGSELEPETNGLFLRRDAHASLHRSRDLVNV